MDRYLVRTGITSDEPQRRYLWTDAFAVCNLVGLARSPSSSGRLALARRLVDLVHETLGQHRSEDPRNGWLSGLPEDQALEHPTQAGLRIGKKLPERGPDEPYDPAVEWDRDGQYFHYLTKWMHALDVLARASGDERPNRWARELGRAAHDAFVYGESHRQGMYWKMSIDLTRPLVPTMGHHDPLDGLVTYAQLAATAQRLHGDAGPDLQEEIASFADLVEGRSWITTDALGLGGLLMDAYRVTQLLERSEHLDVALLQHLLRAVGRGMEGYLRDGELARPATHRLAFRELGLAIGLAGLDRMISSAASLPAEARSALVELQSYLPLQTSIVEFWVDPAHRRSPLYQEHLDINEVMLATALAPEGCLELPP